MKKNKQTPSRWFYGLAVLVILLGILISTWIIKDTGLGAYPALIKGAYDQGQHHLSVPGSLDVELTRSGAYGIYYEYSPLSASVDSLPENMPPAIGCTLTAKTGGAQVKAAPDYVETNKYWSKDGQRAGVLIMSITVNQPDSYTFACSYQDGRTEPQITVALGPNYVWEFFGVAGRIGLSLFGALGTLCGSILIGLIIFLVVAIKR